MVHLRRILLGVGLACVGSVAATAAMAGCEDSSPGGGGGDFDAGPTPSFDGGSPGSPEAAADAGPSDAGANDASDAGSDAAVLPTTLLLTTVGLGTAPPSYAASYHGGTWTALASIGTNEYAATGGGVTFLADGRGLATLRGNEAPSLESSIWSGTTWPTLTALGTYSSLVGNLVPTASGAMTLEQSGMNELDVTLDTFDNGSSTWSLAEHTGLVGDNRTIPTVVLTAGGAPLAIDGVNGQAYAWSLRTGATWSPPAAFPNISSPVDLGAAAVTATLRPKADQIVAVFSHAATPSGPPSLVFATYAAGTWSAAAPLTTNVNAQPFAVPVAVTTLADERVAAAYVGTDLAINVSFFDGANWSAGHPIPSATVGTTYAPLSIAPGLDGAVLEVAYIDSSHHLQHVRMTDTKPTWTSPKSIDATRSYGFVSIAAGP